MRPEIVFQAAQYLHAPAKDRVLNADELEAIAIWLEQQR